MQNVLPKLGTWILDLWNSQTCIIRFELIGSSNLKNKIKGNASRQLALGNSPLLNWLVSEHPRIPRGGQSGWEKRRNERFKHWGRKAPGYWLSLDHFQTVNWMLATDWAQKMLCIIVPNRWTASPEFFSWVHTRRLLTRSRLVCTKEMHAVSLT